MTVYVTEKPLGESIHTHPLVGEDGAFSRRLAYVVGVCGKPLKIDVIHASHQLL